MTVTDRGIGMDADAVSHCFDKFWQAESTDVRRFGGTGIGLYIVQSLVEAMGGTVAVDERAGPGVDIRVHAPPARAVGARARRRPTSAGRPGQSGVGEETSIREFMRQIGIPGRQS